MKLVYTIATILLLASSASGQITNTGSFGNRTIGSSVGGTGTGVGVLDRASAFQQGAATGGEVIQRDATAGFFSNLNSAGSLNAFGGNSFGNLGGFGTTGFGNSPFGFGGGFGGGGFGGGQNPNQQLNSGNSNSAQTQLRTRIRVGFELPERSAEVVSAQMSRRLMSIPQLESLGRLRVSLAGRTATLTGNVATDHARDLAERLVMLEPGVSAVQNDLSVEIVDTTDTLLPQTDRATLLPIPQ